MNKILTDIRMGFTANNINYKLYLHCSYDEGLRVSNPQELFDICELTIKKFKMLSYADVDTCDTFSLLIINNIKFKIENEMLLQHSLSLVSTHTNLAKIRLADTEQIKLNVNCFDFYHRDLLLKINVSITKL